VPGPLAGRRLLIVDENAELGQLVADAAARFGVEASLVASGRDALAALAAGKIDLAVVDLPLSDIRGAELLRALAAAEVATVAVSGVFRGPRAASEVKKLGAADFFEKPFEVDELVRSLARLLGVRLPRPGAIRDEVTGSFPLTAASAEELPVEAGLLPALDDRPAAPAAAPKPLPALAEPLPEAFTPHPVLRQAEAPPPRSGELGRITVPRLLVALHEARATGALTVTRGPVKKIVCVERGVVVYAASNVGTERFGSLCIRRGVVAPEKLDALRAEAPKARVGELLVERGILTPARRAELIAGQIKVILWSTFEWRDGSYELQLARPPEPRVPISLPMGDLILEGMLRASTLPVLAAELPEKLFLAPAPAPAFELYALGLRPQEAELLTLADGTKTVADLAALSSLPGREALAFLQACRAMGVLQEVERVLASTRRMGFM
jgi:CheY-like chemotaxis protein